MEPNPFDGVLQPDAAYAVADGFKNLPQETIDNALVALAKAKTDEEKQRVLLGYAQTAFAFVVKAAKLAL